LPANVCGLASYKINTLTLYHKGQQLVFMQDIMDLIIKVQQSQQNLDFTEQIMLVAIVQVVLFYSKSLDVRHVLIKIVKPLSKTRVVFSLKHVQQPSHKEQYKRLQKRATSA